MKKPVLFFSVVLFLFAASALAQSGRRVVPTPTPTPRAVEKSYSESVPLPKRPPRVSPLFRGVGINADRNVPPADAADTDPIDDGDEYVVKVETNLVTIPVSVFDRNGLYIPGLSKDNFRIYDNGVEQEIEYFATSDQPFSVVLLIDTSPSTDFKIREIRDAARAFVDLLKPQDRVAVVEFDGDVQILTELTTNRPSIYRGIERADFGAGTALYDGVFVSLTRILGKVEGRKAIVLFTDGVDTTSRMANYDSTLDLAEEFDALVFPIYYNTFFELNRRQPGGLPFPGTQVRGRGTTSAEYAVGRKYLEELSGYTGGRIFRPESTPGGLTAAFEGIAEELRRQYNIGYIPSDDGKLGERRQIRVRVDRANLVVRSRDSYIVGAK